MLQALRKWTVPWRTESKRQRLSDGAARCGQSLLILRWCRREFGQAECIIVLDTYRAVPGKAVVPSAAKREIREGKCAEKNLKKVLAGIHSVCTVLPPAGSRPIQGILEGVASGGVGVLFLRWYGSFEILSKIH